MQATTRNILVFCNLQSGEWLTTGKIASESKCSSEQVRTTLGALISKGYEIATRINSEGATEWKLMGVRHEAASHEEETSS